MVQPGNVFNKFREGGFVIVRQNCKQVHDSKLNHKNAGFCYGYMQIIRTYIRTYIGT